MSHDSSPYTTGFSENPDYDYEIRATLGLSVEGASDPGEVLAATAGIKKGDHEAWFNAWANFAERTLATAQAAEAAGHRVSSAESFLRASTYFGVAVNAISALVDTAGLSSTFAKQQAAWDSFVAKGSTAVERVDIPYEATSLPGYFFRKGSNRAGAAPTIVAVNGSDGSLAALWATCVSSALKRGYNVTPRRWKPFVPTRSSATNPPSIVIVDSCRKGRDFRVTSRIARGPRCRPGVPAPRAG